MTIDLQWESCGEVTICEKGLPKFPIVDEVPGIYRLTLNNGWVYIGEAQNLRHRLSEYRRPTKGVEIEHRIHYALIEAGGAMLEIIVKGDLSTRTKRSDIENRLIGAARGEGGQVLNGGGHDHPYPLGLTVRYHENELEKLRKRINAIP